MDQQPTDIPGNVLYQTHSQNSGISALRVQNQPDDQTVSLLLNGPCPILEGRNLPVKTENFAENQNEYHSDVNSRLLHVGTHTLQKRINLLETKHSNVYKMKKHWGQGKKKKAYRISHNPDCIPGSYACEPNRQPCCQVHESSVYPPSISTT